MGFDPHGNYNLWIKGGTLYAELRGAWNTEAAMEFEKDFMALARNLPQAWGHIVYLDHFTALGEIGQKSICYSERGHCVNQTES